MKDATLALHHGFKSDPTTKAVAVPIYQNVAFEFDNAQHGADLFNLDVPGNIYTRIMNPEDGVLLKDNMKGDRRVKVHLGEGWHVPRALLPVPEKRALMLIDPPFEQLDEMQRCAASLKEAVGRMRQTVAAIWYPVKDQRMLRRFYQDLAGTGAPKLLRVELLVHPLDTPNTLTGSGLAIANPPWGLEEELRELLPWLSKKLGQTQGGWQMDWLIAE